MNKRIKKLVEQATEFAHIKNDSQHQFNLDALYEKFAELIIHECVNQCFTDDGSRILNYFGIKE